MKKLLVGVVLSLVLVGCQSAKEAEKNQLVCEGVIGDSTEALGVNTEIKVVYIFDEEDQVVSMVQDSIVTGFEDDAVKDLIIGSLDATKPLYDAMNIEFEYSVEDDRILSTVSLEYAKLEESVRSQVEIQTKEDAKKYMTDQGVDCK